MSFIDAVTSDEPNFLFDDPSTLFAHDDVAPTLPDDDGGSFFGSDAALQQAQSFSEFSDRAWSAVDGIRNDPSEPAWTRDLASLSQPFMAVGLGALGAANDLATVIRDPSLLAEPLLHPIDTMHHVGQGIGDFFSMSNPFRQGQSLLTNFADPGLAGVRVAGEMGRLSSLAGDVGRSFASGAGDSLGRLHDQGRLFPSFGSFGGGTNLLMPNFDSTFYAVDPKSTILMLGATGSYASPLVDAFRHAGHEGSVLGLSRGTVPEPLQIPGMQYLSYADATGLGEDFLRGKYGDDFAQASYRDLGADFLRDNNVGVILNLANRATPNFGEALDTNVAFRQHFIEEAGKSGLDIVAPILSSHSVWADGVGLNESSPLNGKSPYSITTAMSERLTGYRSDALAIPVVRIPTTLGWAPQLRSDGMIQPHVWAEEAARNNGEVTIFDRPQSMRPYGDNIAIADQIARISLFPDPSVVNDTYVLGQRGGGAMRTQDVTDMLGEIAAEEGQPFHVNWSTERPPVGGFRNLTVDTSKYFDIFGGPSVGVRDSLGDVYRFFLNGTTPPNGGRR